MKDGDSDAESLKVFEVNAEPDAGLWKRSFVPTVGVGISRHDGGASEAGERPAGLGLPEVLSVLPWLLSVSLPRPGGRERTPNVDIA